jgi:hypothetical protein
MALEAEVDYMPKEALIERLQALKVTVGITDNPKERKRLNGEIRYLEYLIKEY